jgi:antitoxin ParD1/3/4
MASTMNISLPETLREYVEHRVEEEGFSSVSEYIRQLVREDQKKKDHERLETLLLERLDSGKSSPLTKKDWEDIRGALYSKLAKGKQA